MTNTGSSLIRTARDADGAMLAAGDRVVRVYGTSIADLYGHISCIELNLKGTEWVALVQIEGPGEPGIDTQFVAPLDHLRLAPTVAA
jgi:hypothetical protein